MTTTKIRMPVYVPVAVCLLSLSACCLEPEPEWDDCESFGNCAPAHQSCYSSQCPHGFRCDIYSEQCVVDDRGGGGAGGSDAGVWTPDVGAASMGGGGGKAPIGGMKVPGTGGSAAADATSCSGCDVQSGPAPVATPLCQFNHQCGRDGRCFDGTCQTACTSSLSCGTGDVCHGGFCQPAPTSTGACVFNTQCPGGTCINGACHANCVATCSNAADTCDHGVCKPNRLPSAQCTRSSECAGAFMCVDGACRASCWDDRGCGAGTSGSICLMGYCVAPQEVKPQCERNSECGSATVCVNALCCAPQ